MRFLIKSLFLPTLIGLNISCGDSDATPVFKQTLYIFEKESIGENCAAGGIKVSQGLDENENGELDSGEITSVSYVCDDELVEAGNDGKTFVTVSGEITNEEAAVFLSKNIGSNTQVIRIEKTTGLTELVINAPDSLVELSILETTGLNRLEINGLTYASQVTIEGNEMMSELSLPDLEQVDLGLRVVSNYSMTSLDVTSLHTAFGTSLIQGNPLEELNLLSLVTVGTFDYFGSFMDEITLGNLSRGDVNIDVTSVEDINALQIVNAPLLDLSISCFSVDLDLSNLVSIRSLDLEVASVDLTSLETINPQNDFTSSVLPILNVFGVEVIGLQNLESVNGTLVATQSLAALKSVNGYLEITFIEDGTIFFPNLDYCFSLMVQEFGLLTTVDLDLPNLDSAAHINITSTSLTELSFPSFTKVIDVSPTFQITQNSDLIMVDFPLLSVIPDGSYDFTENALPVGEVNDLLSLFANASPSLTMSGIYLNQQTPAAVPTGQGLLDVTTLRNNGNEVIVDE